MSLRSLVRNRICSETVLYSGWKAKMTVVATVTSQTTVRVSQVWREMSPYSNGIMMFSECPVLSWHTFWWPKDAHSQEDGYCGVSSKNAAWQRSDSLRPPCLKAEHLLASCLRSSILGNRYASPPSDSLAVRESEKRNYQSDSRTEQPSYVMMLMQAEIPNTGDCCYRWMAWLAHCST